MVCAAAMPWCLLHCGNLALMLVLLWPGTARTAWDKEISIYEDKASLCRRCVLLPPLQSNQLFVSYRTRRSPVRLGAAGFDSGLADNQNMRVSRTGFWILPHCGISSFGVCQPHVHVHVVAERESPARLCWHVVDHTQMCRR